MFRAIKRITRRGLCTSSLTGPNSAAEVRKKFIDYFEKEHDHVFIPSSPVIPLNDPTIPLVNAGMFQFKDVFLGLSDTEFTRAVNSQKCIRLKYDETALNDVGKDGIHHTFFEMLGNWSFGDYYKKEACLMAWKFLTENCGLTPDRLYVTYFKGSEELGLEPDTETPEIWAEIGVPRDRILPFGESDNFWQMSDTGPCGPCTEIHYDHVLGNSNASHLVNSKSPLMTEIWNLVFMEYNRTQGGFEKLERHYVDTGMGLERLVSILQGEMSNYETDIFRPLYAIIRDMSGHVGYTGSYDQNKMDIAYRALADYSRMITVVLSDDLFPSRSGRLRKVFRRAFHLSKNVFQVKSGLIQELSKWVTEYLSLAYPEVAKNADKVQFIISEEEKNFTLKEESYIKKAKFLKEYYKFYDKIEIYGNIEGCHNFLTNKIKSGAKEINCSDAWKIIDTYGISKELLTNMAEILGLGFDVNDFEEYKKKILQEKTIQYHNRFNASRTIQISNLPVITTKVTTDLLNYKNVEMNIHEDCNGNELPVKVVGIVMNGNYVNNMEGIDSSSIRKLGVIFDETNFIPHSDFYFGDSGTCLIGESRLNINGLRMIRNNRNNIAVHYVSLDSENLNSLSVGLEGKLILDSNMRRQGISNSTGQLLLQAVLCKNFKVLCNLHSFSSPRYLKIIVDSYNTFKPNGNDMLELEKEVIAVMKKGGRIEREMVDVKEVRGMKDVFIKCGQVFLSTKVPIWKLTTPDFSHRFYHPSPVFPDISMIEDFVILGYGLCNKRHRNRYINANTGKSAIAVHNETENLLKDWYQLRNFHLAEGEDINTVSKKIDELESFYEKITKKDLPFYITSPIQNEISFKLHNLQKICGDEASLDRKIQPSKKK